MAVYPTQFLQSLEKSCAVALGNWIVCSKRHDDNNSPHSIGLLRACRNWQCRRTADERDELAPPHSITSSASARSFGGMLRPSALAVFRLITNSIFVGCKTGRSAGLDPLRIFPA